MPPMFAFPHMFVCPYMFICSPRGVHTPHMAHTLLCICVFLEALHVVGDCNGLPFVLASHTQSLVPCASVCFRDISILCWHFPSIEGFGAVPPSFGGFGGIST